MQGRDEEIDIDLTEVAEESPEESAEAEREAVGEDQPDVGDTVPPSQAQSAHADEPQADEDDQPLLGGMMSSDRPESSVHE